MPMKIVHKALTFDDVLLVPNYSSILPSETSLKTPLTSKITLTIPLLSAPMDTVTEARLAIAMAQVGGIGIIHKNMTVEDQAAHVRRVKKFESGVVKDPITVSPTTTVRELLRLTQQHNFSGMPVVDGANLVGIITNRDVRFESDTSQPVANLMTPKEKLVTVHEKASREEAIAKLHKHRIEKILIVNDSFQLKGMITVRDILNSKVNPNACKDAKGQLRVGAAVGVGGDSRKRAQALIAADVDVIVVDTSHGHSQGVLDMVSWIRQHFPDVQLIGGNVVTAEGARALVDAGVNAVKVGIGPGSICTTRVVTGVGVPQITAVANVAEELARDNIPVIADGGIRFSGDISKALAAGASCVMIGSLLAGTQEAPGDIVLYQGRSYKRYWGMGSVKAMSQAQGSSDRYFQDASKGSDKLVPEGIEGRVPYRGHLSDVIYQMVGGVRSAMGYLGCESIKALHTKATFSQVTSAGRRESHVHDVIITKEAPNYSIEEGSQ